MKYAQVAAELKAKGELGKVIQMLQACGKVDYVLYSDDHDETIDNDGTPEWYYDLEIYFERLEDNPGLRGIFAKNYEGFNDVPCLLVRKETSYLAPVGYEYSLNHWETEDDAGKTITGSPFATKQIRVQFAPLYTLCPELFNSKPIPAGNEVIENLYWLLPDDLSLNYEVGLELLAACQAA